MNNKQAQAVAKAVQHVFEDLKITHDSEGRYITPDNEGGVESCCYVGALLVFEKEQGNIVLGDNYTLPSLDSCLNYLQHKYGLDFKNRCRIYEWNDSESLTWQRISEKLIGATE